MKYTMKALDQAIDYILPELAEARELFAEFNRPRMIQMIAEKHFREDPDNSEYLRSLCYSIVREAALDLHSKGYIVWGDTEILHHFKEEK